MVCCDGDWISKVYIYRYVLGFDWPGLGISGVKVNTISFGLGWVL